jgi:hypothetical protein
MTARSTIDDLDFSTLGLDAEQLAALVGERGECVFAWSTSEGHPVGVVVAYIFRDGRFWTTGKASRNRVSALRARPWSSVVINKEGLSATFKGVSRIHGPEDDDWDSLRGWFLPALSGVDPAADDPGARALLRYLDGPHQVIIETPAQLVGSFDFTRFGAAITAAVEAIAAS